MSQQPSQPFDLNAPQNAFGGPPLPVPQASAPPSAGLPPASQPFSPPFAPSILTESAPSVAAVPVMTEQDIFSIPALPPALPETKEFCFNGVKRMLTVRTDAQTDAQQYTRVMLALAASEYVQRDPHTLKVLSASAKVVTQTGTVELTEPGYIGQLALLACTVISPIMSIDGWHGLVQRIGVKGAQAGWQGLDDLASWAMQANRITRESLLGKTGEGESGAGEGTPGRTSSDVSTGRAGA